MKNVWKREAFQKPFGNILLLSPLIYGVGDQKFSSHIRMHFSGCCGSTETPRVKLVEAQGGSKQTGTSDMKVKDEFLLASPNLFLIFC